MLFVRLNGIREICARQPLAMNETLLQDLTQYKNHRDKGIIMGARSLIMLYREANPEMLLRKDRGREASMRMKDGSIKKLQFGSVDASAMDALQGVELLDQQEQQNDDDGWEGWEVDEDTSDSDDEGWIDVSSDDENGYVNIAMSDDDEEEEDAKTKEEEGNDKTDGQQKKRRIGKRRLRKLQEAQGREELTEEQKEKLRQEEEARRAEEEKKREAMLKVASTRILTPADFAKLNELRETQAIEQAMGKKRSAEER